jgi:hypothetical protein
MTLYQFNQLDEMEQDEAVWNGTKMPFVAFAFIFFRDGSSRSTKL